MNDHSRPLTRAWAFALATILFVAIGAWALRLQALRARDTIRKHDIEDLEQALLRYGRLSGTYPPDDVPAWCGTLSDPAADSVRTAIEAALRRDEKYAKPEKPFPSDPVYAGTDRDYLYWKTSPVSFELLAELEADRNNSRAIDRTTCAPAPQSATRDVGPAPRDPRPDRGEVGYDYSVVSTHRTPF